MDYKKKYNKLLEESKRAKEIYLKKALMKECKELLHIMGGPFIKEEEYRREILPYWEKFKYKPPKIWFDLYCCRDKKINKYKVPADLYYNKLMPYLNNLNFWKALADKNNYDYLFSDINRPKTICKCMNGFFYDGKDRFIREEEAIDIIYNYKKSFIIKPTIITGSSRGIIAVDNGFENKKEIKNTFTKYNKNFICQERIKQHRDLAVLNKDCVNTIRVVSLLYKNEVHNVLYNLRIGDVKKRFLKTAKGDVIQGIALDILENGQLYKKGLNKSGEWVETDYSGNKLSSHKIPSMEKIKRFAKELHLRLPHFKCIGWDFSVDEKGEPILIEFNVCPGVEIQINSSDAIFGKLTNKVLENYFNNKEF